MKTKTLVILLIVNAGLTGMLFASTNPDNIPVSLLVIPILALFFSGVLVTALVLRIFRVYRDNRRKEQVLSILGGLGVVFWVIVQSSGGITLGDAILLTLMMIIALFYIAKY